MTKEELIEKIASHIRTSSGFLESLDWADLDEQDKDIFRGDARRIMYLVKQAGYVQLVDDQSLPENPYEKSILPVELEKAYKEGQQDMLKAGFKKVKSASVSE